MRRMATAVALATALAAASAGGAVTAQQIPDTTGFEGGLIVYLGCGAASVEGLTIGLCASEHTVVHGLDTDPAKVARARESIRSEGFYGPVSVDTFDGKRLPYVDNLVNLVVAGGKWQVASGDLTRVPAPMQNLGKEGGGHRIYPPAPKRGASGERLMTTAGFLDDANNEGKYWTYGERWPGWDRKMRKAGVFGQLLAIDEETVYGVNAFTEDVRVRRGRTIGGKGERIFARDHGQKKDRWSTFVPIQVRALVVAGDRMFVAGPPDEVPDGDPLAAIEGRRGAVLWTVSTPDGSKVGLNKLDSPPVFDGVIAADKHLYVFTRAGTVICLAGGAE